jgi:hypothetical protein
MLADAAALAAAAVVVPVAGAVDAATYARLRPAVVVVPLVPSLVDLGVVVPDSD